MNSNVQELHANWQRSVDDVYKKDDWGRRVETLLHEERTRHQNTTNHYTTLLEDKEAQLHELRRCLEAQRFQMSQALEDHSRAGQNLAQMLERERREWAIERETLQSELYGTQQLMRESETVCQFVKKVVYLNVCIQDLQRDLEDAKNRAQTLEEQLDELRTLNVELTKANEELGAARKHSSEQRRSAYEKEISENTEEISDLKLQLSRVNDRIEENFQRQESEMNALRQQLRETIEERDKLVSEVHALREKELHCRSVRSSSISSVIRL